METNCLLYFPKSQSLVGGLIDENGNVYLYIPNHGGGWFEFLKPSFMDMFNISIYPG